jgi:hypothetical protein
MKTSLLLFAALAALLAVVALLPLCTPALKSLGQKADAALFDYMARTGAVLGMTTLAANKSRAYEIGDHNELPMVAADIIYEGAAVGDNGSGLARPLVAADPFLGFAVRQADNSAGAASAVNVLVKQRGEIVLAVTGAASADDVGTTVYASDDDTFTLTSTSNTSIGKVARWVSGTTCVVYFEAVQVRSI